MAIRPVDYSVYLYHMGGGDHQLFIKNVSAEADFIRVVTGCTGFVQGKRVGKVLNRWIITPLRSSNEHVHLGDIRRSMYKSKRLWVAFEAVQRGKRNKTVGMFVALSPQTSIWRTKTGALTHLSLSSSAANISEITEDGVNMDKSLGNMCRKYIE